jgi:hypothetical protein
MFFERQRKRSALRNVSTAGVQVSQINVVLTKRTPMKSGTGSSGLHIPLLGLSS